MPTSRSNVRDPANGQGAPDAVQLLIADHKQVKGLFKEYDKLVESGKGDKEKEALAR